ncbi:histidine kinase [Chthonobacter rhizosphaerae]|uniref:histidine kinase n=1 Tax=Chthonobacter rhizosphaerae TaxID=2735553 RepID=UPI0015EF7A74|nr:histidine kinase [Chthonobacter rhizosphaerae]
MNSTRKTVLIAEDEAVISLGLEDVVADLGARTAGPFATCREVMDWLTANECDAAVLDLTLRDGDLMDCAAAMAAKGVPVLITSGHMPSDHPVPGAYWVGKPFAFTAIRDRLADMLGGPAPSA